MKCRTEDNVNNGHYCCKTTTRRGKARPQDFYCFLEKGSPQANHWYCLGLADMPPHIHGLEKKPAKPADDDINPQPDDKPREPSLRKKVKVQTERLPTLVAIKLFLIMLNGSLLLGLLFRKVVETHYTPRQPRRIGRDGNYVN